MRDCDHCQRIRNGTCGGLECQGFVPVPYIDPAILENAAESLDNSRHNRSKYSSRRVLKSEERFKSAAAHEERKTQPVKRTPPRILQKGTLLFYKDKQTGELGRITVREVHVNKFTFTLNGKRWELPNSTIGKRVFFSPNDAMRYGKLSKKK